MMPVHHFRVSPCVIIVKYGKCAANLMVSLCIHLELADVIANVSTLICYMLGASRVANRPELSGTSRNIMGDFDLSRQGQLQSRIPITAFLFVSVKREKYNS